jgi:hypothetical protein
MVGTVHLHFVTRLYIEYRTSFMPLVYPIPLGDLTSKFMVHHEPFLPNAQFLDDGPSTHFQDDLCGLILGIPSGKPTNKYETSHFFMGKSTISTGPWLQVRKL